MPSNDFLPFAYGGSANVETQATYAAESRLLNGLVSGIVPSNLLNKTLRQSSIMSAVLAQFIADKSGANSVDDGTTATLELNLTAAITAYWALKNGNSANTFLVAPATASGHAVNLGQFTSGTGWRKTPDGFIEQWGIANNSASADVTVTFPISFTSLLGSLVITPQSSGSGAFCSHNTQSGTGFNFSTWVSSSTRATATPNYWYAIGK